MERLARLVMHHRRIVSAVWLVLFLGGMFSASALSDRLSLDFSLPGQPGDDAEQQLIETYGVSTFDTYVAVVTVPEGETVQDNQDAITQIFDTAATAVREDPTLTAIQDMPMRVVTFASTGDEGFITEDGRTTFALMQAPIPIAFGPYVEVPLRPSAHRGGRGSRVREWPDVIRSARGWRRHGGSERPGRDAVRRGRRTAGLDLRVRVVPGPASDADRGGVDPDDLHARPTPDDVQRCERHRAVPHRLDRARGCDRLLAAPRLAMA